MKHNGTAAFTCLGVNSTLRLYTSAYAPDIAQVGINFFDGPSGLFNGMKFKDMVAGGITFEYAFYKELVAGGNTYAAPAIKFTIYSPTVGASSWTNLVWEPYRGGCGLPSCSNTPPTGTWHAMSVGNTTGVSNVGNGNSGWWNTRNQNNGGSLAAWAAWFNTTAVASVGYGPTFMADAIIISAMIGVGSNNQGVTSHVNSLRIAANGYDWKWIFGDATSCS
jgi:hypothetical protein